MLVKTFQTFLLLATFNLVSSHQERIVAVGDLHGDCDHALEVMRMAKVVDGGGHWIGGNCTTLVQTGDVLDRGRDTIKLFHWLMNLQDEAAAAGGRFVMLLGNHELMNLKGDLKYVHKKEIKSFKSKKKRKLAFSKEGWIGSFLRTLNITQVINGTVFVHGGIKPEFLDDGLDALNLQSLDYLVNDTSKQLDKRPLYKSDFEGPLWYRGYYKDSEEDSCRHLQEALEMIPAKRMVMGHCVTESRSIETRCDGRAIFIDVGISSYYGSHNFAALELTNSSAKAIYPDDVEVELPFSQ